MRKYVVGRPKINEQLYAIRTGRSNAEGRHRLMWWSRHIDYMDGAADDPYGGRWGDCTQYLTLVPRGDLDQCPWRRSNGSRAVIMTSIEEANQYLLNELAMAPHLLSVWCWTYIATSFSIERG